ncbi:MAG: xylose isomerase [Armatimonadetes bacterium]|nr:xylose isomerase [Armatimonadota bacterium]
MYEPRKEDKFSFGLWTVANRGRDPFGEATRPTMSPTHIVKKLAEIGAWGVNLHDNDLIPIDASASERDRIISDFKKALADNGLAVGMATTNLFYDPVFKDGAFTANDGRVRSYAIQKVMNAIDVGAELGAPIFVFWGGREGTEVDFSKDHAESVKRTREAINFLCNYVKDQGYNIKFSLEAKPNEPRGDIYFSTSGAMLGFIATLQYPEMVGVNPEVAHELMANLNVAHVVGQCLDADKLFIIHLNGQKYARYDQDLRFGSEDLNGAFSLVHMLETHNFQGSLEFDAHAYRTEDEEGVWDFARGCMRNYLILREKSRQFQQDAEAQDILKSNDIKCDSWNAVASGYSRDTAEKIKNSDYPKQEMSERGLRYERLDQIVGEILMGVR